MQLGATSKPFQVANEAPSAIPHPHTHFEGAVLNDSLDKIGMSIMTFGVWLFYALPREYFYNLCQQFVTEDLIYLINGCKLEQVASLSK